MKEVKMILESILGKRILEDETNTSEKRKRILEEGKGISEGGKVELEGEG